MRISDNNSNHRQDGNDLIYTPERKAEFLLSNAVDAAGYAAAREEVRRLGLDPDAVPHCKPAGV